MIKKLLFAGALLWSSLAYGADPSAPLSVEVVPAAPAIPAGAMAAGFTTTVLHADFTASQFTDTRTWLDCAGAAIPRWWQYVYIVPQACPTITTDGGVQVLQHMISGNAATRLLSNGISASPVQSGTCNLGICFPATTFYMEGVIRAQSGNWPAGAFMNAPWAAQGSQGCTMEFDSFETFDPIYSDGGFHWCGQSTKFIWQSGPLPNPPPGFDYKQYNRYGIRVTTNGTNSIYQCNYINDYFQGCISLTAGNDGITQAMITNPQFITAISSMGSVSNFSGTFIEYLKSITVWSCANWRSPTAAGGCATSNPNPK